MVAKDGREEKRRGKERGEERTHSKEYGFNGSTTGMTTVPQLHCIEVLYLIMLHTRSKSFAVRNNEH